MKTKRNLLLLPLSICILSLIYMITINISFTEKHHKNYSQFLTDISTNKIAEVYLDNNSTIRVKSKNAEIYTTDNPRKDNFKEELLKNNIKVYEGSFKTSKELIPASIFFLSLCSLLFIVIKNAKFTTKGSFSKYSMNVNSIENCPYSFANIKGNEEAKDSVKDIINFLKDPQKYSSYGARMPKGIILYGEPGTGKTLMAKAIAGEADVPFYAVSGSDFIQVYVGVGASRIRDLFKKAKNHGKAVIFIDEIDAIGKKRGKSASGSSDEKDQTLNALLTEMSGFNEKEGIIVIAATNRLDVLDDALLRPGRFDRHIEVALPDIKGRKEIMALHLKNKPHNDIDLDNWARKTCNFSGAKLENLINEAAIIACNENHEFISDTTLDKAYSIVLAGHEKLNRDHLREEDRKITAIHESGHALLSHILLPNEKLSKVTIIPSTKGAGGYTLSIPEDKLFTDKSYLMNKIMILLGGRAAEEIYLNIENITTGSSNDLQKCTNIIGNMVGTYGMGKSMGLLNIDTLSSLGISNPSLIIEECKDILDELYESTKDILLDNKSTMDYLINELLEKETLYEKDIKKILG